MFTKGLSLLGLAVALIASPIASANGFCEGFEEGYKAGYCYQKSFCIAPITPICPLPRINEVSFQDGYNRGFLTGLNAR